MDAILLLGVVAVWFVKTRGRRAHYPVDVAFDRAQTDHRVARSAFDAQGLHALPMLDTVAKVDARGQTPRFEGFVVKLQLLLIGDVLERSHSGFADQPQGVFSHLRALGVIQTEIAKEFRLN